VLAMAAIERILIRSESGYCFVNYAYKDKLTIDRNSIRYGFKPYDESLHDPHQWSYRTDSNAFANLFDELCAGIANLLEYEQWVVVRDGGSITFEVVYEDGSRIQKEFTAENDKLTQCLSTVEHLIPGCENSPQLLTWLSDDNEGRTFMLD
jgi:hypothetical protein